MFCFNWEKCVPGNKGPYASYVSNYDQCQKTLSDYLASNTTFKKIFTGNLNSQISELQISELQISELRNYKILEYQFRSYMKTKAELITFRNWWSCLAVHKIAILRFAYLSSPTISKILFTNSRFTKTNAWNSPRSPEIPILKWNSLKLRKLWNFLKSQTLKFFRKTFKRFKHLRAKFF